MGMSWSQGTSGPECHVPLPLCHLRQHMLPTGVLGDPLSPPGTLSFTSAMTPSTGGDRAAKVRQQATPPSGPALTSMKLRKPLAVSSLISLPLRFSPVRFA